MTSTAKSITKLASMTLPDVPPLMLIAPLISDALNTGADNPFSCFACTMGQHHSKESTITDLLCQSLPTSP
jgi:hypothetical protein